MSACVAGSATRSTTTKSRTQSSRQCWARSPTDMQPTSGVCLSLSVCGWLHFWSVSVCAAVFWGYVFVRAPRMRYVGPGFETRCMAAPAQPLLIGCHAFACALTFICRAHLKPFSPRRKFPHLIMSVYRFVLRNAELGEDHRFLRYTSPPEHP